MYRLRVCSVQAEGVQCTGCGCAVYRLRMCSNINSLICENWAAALADLPHQFFYPSCFFFLIKAK